MERVNKYILGLAVALSAVILLLAIIVAVILNSGSLDQLARDRITGYFNSEFEGRLEIEQVDLQFPSRIVVHAPSLYRKDHETADITAKKITLDLNFLRLLSDFSNITIRSLRADSLYLHLERYPDGSTSIERIFSPADKEKPQQQGLEKFLCGRLHLHDTSFEYVSRNDSTAGGNDTLGITGIELKGKKLRYSPQNISGVVNSLRFAVPRHGVALQDGSAKLAFTDQRIEITNLRMKTARSDIRLSFGLYDFNIFSSERRGSPKSPVFLELKPSTLDAGELSLVPGAPPIPEGLYSLSCKAKGTLGRVTVDHAVVSRDEKDILRLEGELSNLDKPQALGYGLATEGSRISGEFLQKAVRDSTARTLLLPFGDIGISGTAEGNRKELSTEMSLETKAGGLSLSLQTDMPVDGDALYSGTFELREFGLHRFVSDDTSATSGINCTGAFSGKGLTPRPVKADLSIEIAPSYWGRQDIASGRAALGYAGTVLESSLDLDAKGSSLALNGKIAWQDGVPVYEGRGSARGIDVSKSLDTKDISSNLNFSLQFNGRHFDPEQLYGNLLVRFSKSTINDYTLKKDSELSLRVARQPSSSTVALKSDFLDFSAAGTYTFGDFLSGTSLTVAAISRELRKNNIWNPEQLPPLSNETVGKNFSADYTLAIRDLSPLELFLPLDGYDVRASASGKSYRKNGSLRFTSVIDISRLEKDSTLSLENASLDIDAAYSRDGVSKISLGGKAAAAHSGRRNIEDLTLDALYDDTKLTASANFSAKDIQRTFAIGISAERKGNLIEAAIDNLSIRDAGGSWSVNKGSRIDVGKNYTRIYGLKLAKPGQAISCSGLLSSELAGRFECGISNLDLSELSIFFPDAALAGSISSSLVVSGPPGSKTTSLKLSGGNLAYDDIVIGDLDLAATHRGERLRADFSTGKSGPEPVNDIRGSASIPLRINWSPPGYSVPDNQPISVSCTAEHLSAEILEIMLPFFETAEGTIPAKLTVRGRTPDPEIYFSTTLDNTAITVTPTETAYRLSGLVEINPKRAMFKNISIRDDFGGTGKINGAVDLEKLEPTTVDLVASFNNLLLFNKKDKKDETSFGTITGTTDRVRFFGDISQPVLTGSLLITGADFTLYRTGSNESAKYVGVEKFIEFVPRNPSPVDTTATGEAVSSENPEFYYSLIDIVQIQDLRLESSAPLKYNMIFDRARGEKLETTLQNLSINVNKRQQSYRLFGSVSISAGQYRFSNTNFDLDDGGRIVWNNVDIRNGVMENLFGRKYVNATNAQTGESDNVRLLLAIQGTLNNPDVQMGYFLNDDSQPYSSENMIGRQSSKIDPNAELNVISLLLTKQWYIRPGSQSSYGKLPFSSVGISTGTGLISSQISQFVEKAAGLESFNVNVGVDEQGSLSGLEFSLAFLVPGTGGKVRFIGTGSSPDIGETALFDYYGNSQRLEYRITPKLFVEAYRSYGLFGNDVTTTNLLEPTETYGISISYRERFYTWEQFWGRVFGSSPD